MDWHDFYIYDSGLLINRKTGRVLSAISSSGYLLVAKNGTQYLGHRIIWKMFNGPIPEGMCIDHIDGNKLNNLIENLRLASYSDNNANRNTNTKSGLPRGVSKSGSGYRAQVYYKRKAYYIGTYKTVEEAAIAYNEASKELWGDFSRPNEISTCTQNGIVL